MSSIKRGGISGVAEQLSVKLLRGLCVLLLYFHFLMDHVVPQLVGKLLLALKTVTCVLMQSVASMLNPVTVLRLTALLRLCASQSTSDCWNVVWSRAVRQWLCHDAASRCLFSGFDACLVGLLWCI